MHWRFPAAGLSPVRSAMGKGLVFAKEDDDAGPWWCLLDTDEKVSPSVDDYLGMLPFLSKPDKEGWSKHDNATLHVQVLEANGICCAKAFRGATVFVYRDDAVTEAVVVSKIRVRASEPLHAWLSKYAPGPQYKVNQVVPPGGADLPWKVYVAAKAAVQSNKQSKGDKKVDVEGKQANIAQEAAKQQGKQAIIKQEAKKETAKQAKKEATKQRSDGKRKRDGGPRFPRVLKCNRCAACLNPSAKRGCLVRQGMGVLWLQVLDKAGFIDPPLPGSWKDLIGELDAKARRVAENNLRDLAEKVHEKVELPEYQDDCKRWDLWEPLDDDEVAVPAAKQKQAAPEEDEEADRKVKKAKKDEKVPAVKKRPTEDDEEADRKVKKTKKSKAKDEEVRAAAAGPSTKPPAASPTVKKKQAPVAQKDDEAGRKLEKAKKDKPKEKEVPAAKQNQAAVRPSTKVPATPPSKPSNKPPAVEPFKLAEDEEDDEQPHEEDEDDEQEEDKEDNEQLQEGEEDDGEQPQEHEQDEDEDDEHEQDEDEDEDDEHEQDEDEEDSDDEV